jgi:hypothetical protein
MHCRSWPLAANTNWEITRMAYPNECSACIIPCTLTNLSHLSFLQISSLKIFLFKLILGIFYSFVGNTYDKMSVRLGCVCCHSFTIFPPFCLCHITPNCNTKDPTKFVMLSGLPYTTRVLNCRRLCRCGHEDLPTYLVTYLLYVTVYSKSILNYLPNHPRYSIFTHSLPICFPTCNPC